MYRLAIEEALSKLLNDSSALPQSLLQKAARYATLSKAKRLRPLFAITAAACYGDLSLKALLPACALEMVHTYSLIHDDLPCMDNADFRRGKPSLHKVFGDGEAVLVGDFLLTYAFEILATAPHLHPEQRLSLILQLSRAIGAEGMVGGQMMDIKSEFLDKHLLLLMHEKKTAALFAASLTFGGIIAEANASDCDLLHSAGLHFGLAFQIFDDLEDASNPTDRQKASAATILGNERAKESADIALGKALQNLKKLSIDAAPLIELVQNIMRPLYGS